MSRLLLFAALALASGACASTPTSEVAPMPDAPAVITQTPLTWEVEGKRFAGTLVIDAARAAQGKLPGVLVVHQWMGPTAHELERAEMLARLGYAAFVADIYGVDGRPADRAAAGPTAGAYKNDRALFRRRLLDNLAQLAARPEVDPTRLAAIGFCFGGTGVLELARAGADVKGVVSFHGGLDSPTPADGKNIRAKVLVLHGAVDPFVPADGIAAMQAELEAAKVDWQMIYYSGAVHSFTHRDAGNDPSKGAAYDERADRRSWEAMRAFLAEALR